MQSTSKCHFMQVSAGRLHSKCILHSERNIVLQAFSRTTERNQGLVVLIDAFSMLMLNTVTESNNSDVYEGMDMVSEFDICAKREKGDIWMSSALALCARKVISLTSKSVYALFSRITQLNLVIFFVPISMHFRSLTQLWTLLL